jgi:hypothetical protein
VRVALQLKLPDLMALNAAVLPRAASYSGVDFDRTWCWSHGYNLTHNGRNCLTRVKVIVKMQPMSTNWEEVNNA